MLNTTKAFHFLALSVSLVVFVGLRTLDACAYPLPQDTVSVAEPTLRKLATKVVVPTYPTKGIKRRQQGRVVVQVLIDEQGKLSRITPLEAPDDSFLNSVTSAVKQWRWGAATHGRDRRQARIDGKLTFYFKFQNDQPVVLSPGAK
jgi:TonB family protein